MAAKSRFFAAAGAAAHYQRWKNHGDPLGGRHNSDNSGACSVSGCGGLAKLRGLCRRHHHKFLRYGDPSAGATYYRGQLEDWLQGVVGTQTDDCILWPFSVAPNGYGTTNQGGAHRRVCRMTCGAPPTADHEVAHSCNVRACVNPRHLRWATKSENMADKIGHGTIMRGERNHQAKLTAAEVLAIRRLEGAAILRDVADRFGVSICTVHRIWRRETWAWLEEPSPAQ